MPHVVIEQAGPLATVFTALEPFVVSDSQGILRITDTWLNRRGTAMLLEAVVVDKPRTQAFFIQLSQKESAITVRLLPATDPEEKTPAVKRLLALVARRVRQLVPESRYGKTNLQDFLTEPDHPAA